MNMDRILKRTTAAAMVLLLSGVSARIGVAEAQQSSGSDLNWAPGTYMVQAVAQVISQATLIGNLTTYGFGDNPSVMGAYLQESGRTVAFRHSLQAGTDYLYIGGGDEDAQDVDLHLFDASGSEVASDSDNDPSPYVEYTPSTSGMYTIRLTLYRASRGSFCALVALKEGGWSVPLKNLEEAVGHCIVIGKSAHLTAQVTGSQGADFHDDLNQWAFYGAVLREGESSKITYITLSQGPYGIIAAGDSKASDIDLFLRNENAGFVLGSD